METNDKFLRFLEMTDHPERFSDEELMQLVRDPEMAAWYKTLRDVEPAAKEMTSAPSRRGRKIAMVVGWMMATAAVLTAVYMVVDLPSASTGNAGVVACADDTVPHSETIVESAQMAQAAVSSDSKKKEKKHSNVIQQPRADELAIKTRKDEHVALLSTKNQPSNPDNPVVEPVSPTKEDEDMPLVPADKQALVDIYLAEMALQIAYTRQAQQQQVCAYAASLSDNEPENEQLIIAF